MQRRDEDKPNKRKAAAAAADNNNAKEKQSLAQIFWHNLLDVLKIYLKLLVVTAFLYYAAEWYLVNYADIDEQVKEERRQIRANSTVMKVYEFVYHFFLS